MPPTSLCSKRCCSGRWVVPPMSQAHSHCPCCSLQPRAPQHPWTPCSRPMRGCSTTQVRTCMGLGVRTGASPCLAGGSRPCGGCWLGRRKGDRVGSVSQGSITCSLCSPHASSLPSSLQPGCTCVPAASSPGCPAAPTTSSATTAAAAATAAKRRCQPGPGSANRELSRMGRHLCVDLGIPSCLVPRPALAPSVGVEAGGKEAQAHWPAGLGTGMGSSFGHLLSLVP